MHLILLITGYFLVYSADDGLNQCSASTTHHWFVLPPRCHCRHHLHLRVVYPLIRVILVGSSQLPRPAFSSPPFLYHGLKNDGSHSEQLQPNSCWSLISLWELRLVKKLSNRVLIQAPVEELSFLSPKPGASHPPPSLLTKLTSEANK
jgi:hypothetical protein